MFNNKKLLVKFDLIQLSEELINQESLDISFLFVQIDIYK